MAWPTNSELTSGIVSHDFFSSLETAMTSRFHPRISVQKSQDDITTTFTSLGSVPEPKQTSGVLGGGPKQQAMLKDWTVVSTVNEWESEIYVRRIVAESKPNDVREKASQMAFKAAKSNDAYACQALASTTALGYDGIALFSASHAESGSNQTNLSTSVIAADPASAPTAAEAEAALILMEAALLILQDDQSTPVNEGVDRYILLCSPGMRQGFVAATDQAMSNYAIDSSGATGIYRGRVEVISSAYCTDSGLTGGNSDVCYLIAHPEQSNDYPLARCSMVDWQFNNNLFNDNSDEWNKGKAYLRSHAVHVYVPWKWQTIVRHTFTT